MRVKWGGSALHSAVSTRLETKKKKKKKKTYTYTYYVLIDWSISILLYDHHAFPFSFFPFFFRVTKFGMLLILIEKSGIIQQQSCFSSFLARAIDKIPV